jgi:hypothetical protein
MNQAAAKKANSVTWRLAFYHRLFDKIEILPQPGRVHSMHHKRPAPWQ